jgi:hypothetical protein
MCPETTCKADNPVQVLIDPHVAEQIGHPELANAIRCQGCGTVWRVEGEGQRILGRFTGQDMVSGVWRLADSDRKQADDPEP